MYTRMCKQISKIYEHSLQTQKLCLKKKKSSCSSLVVWHQRGQQMNGQELS